MSRHVNLAVVVIIDGIREQLYGASVSIPSSFFASPYIGVNCVDLDSITSIREEMPQLGGIGKASGLTLRLIDRNEVLSTLFSRDIEQVQKAFLAETLVAESGTTSVVATRDITDFEPDGYIYVGQETIAFNGRATDTFDVTGRGALNSPISEHLVDNDPARSWNPVITAHPVFWEGRGATISFHEVRGGVISATGVERVRGIIADEPYQEDDGTFSLSIVQDSARFESELGDTRFATSLVEGFHYFDGETEREIIVSETLPEGSVIFRSVNTQLIRASSGVDHIDVIDTGAHEAIFDTNRGNYVADPGNGNLVSPGSRDLGEFIVNGYTVNGADDEQYDLTANVPGTLSYGADVVNARQERSFAVSIAPTSGVQVWPAEAIAAINDVTNVTHTAAGEFWYLDVTLSADGSTVFARMATPVNEDNRPYFSVSKSNPPFSEFLYFPLFRVPDRDPLSSVRVPAQGIGEDIGFEAEPFALVPASLGFYQRRAKYLLVRNNIFGEVSEDAPGALIVRVPDGRECVIRFDEVSAVTYEGANIGYRLRVTDESRDDPAVFSFENTADSKVTIAPLVSFRREDPRQVILKILLSGFSSTPGYPNATYSVLPTNYGLRFTEDAVDIQGILSYPLSGVLREVTFRPVRPIRASDLIEPLLQAMGAALVSVNIGGTRKVTLVPARVSADPYISEIIGNGDWQAKKRPKARKFGTVYTNYSISANYDAPTDKFLAQGNFEDNTAYDARNKAQTLNIEIRGLTLGVDAGAGQPDAFAYSALVSLYKSLRSVAGSKVRLFRGAVLWTTGENFTIGRTVAVNIAEARDGAGVKGIVNKGMLIQAVEFDPVRRVVALDLLYRGRNVGSFAPSAEVTAVGSANTLTLSANEYSDPFHPYTEAARTDRYYFTNAGTLPVAGTPVELVHAGEEENNTTGTITAIDLSTGVATITGHGLSVGDRIRPLAWDDAPAFMRVYVFLSVDGVLGTADDPGFVYS